MPRIESHTHVYPNLVNLLATNGDHLLEQHIKQNPSNVQYTSKFSVPMLLEAMDTWLERKLLTSLMSSPLFSILADECQDIGTQQELSICCCWIVNGCPEEHFLTVLHVKFTAAEAITDTLTSFIVLKLVGQGYDGATTFSSNRTGVLTRTKELVAHAYYIHCSCH